MFGIGLVLGIVIGAVGMFFYLFGDLPVPTPEEWVSGNGGCDERDIKF